MGGIFEFGISLCYLEFKPAIRSGWPETNLKALTANLQSEQFQGLSFKVKRTLGSSQIAITCRKLWSNLRISKLCRGRRTSMLC